MDLGGSLLVTGGYGVFLGCFWVVMGGNGWLGLVMSDGWLSVVMVGSVLVMSGSWLVMGGFGWLCVGYWVVMGGYGLVMGGFGYIILKPSHKSD